jgi:hypothetical protein
MTLALNNEDGRFTPGNLSSPYHPYVRRNSPIRVAVTTAPVRTGAAPWPAAQLADDFDDGRIDPVWSGSYGGAIEIDGKARIPVVPGGFAAYQSARQWRLQGSHFSVKIVTLPAVNGSSSASVSVMANSATPGTRAGFQYSPVTGQLRCASDVSYFDAGATVLTYSPIEHAWLRIRESGGTLRWETASDGVTWVVRRTLPTPAWVVSDTVVMEMVGTRTGGVADYVEFDLANHVPRWRHWGSVNDWPVTWDGLHSTVTISSTDLFKRLNRHPPLKSCLVEEVLLYGPAAYYPLTEPSGSTSAGDLSGSAAGALAVTQVSISGGVAEFGADGPPATGEPSLSLTPASTSAGKYLVGDLGGTFQSESGSYWKLVEVFFKTTTVGRAVLGLFSPDLDHELVLALNGSGALVVEHVDDGPGARLITTLASGNLANGAWHHVVYDEANRSVYIDGALVGTGLAISGMGNLRTLNVGGYRGGRLWAGEVGHVAIYLNPTALGALRAQHYEAGMTAFDGESATSRIARLARYAGVDSLTVYGVAHDPVAGQGPPGTGVLARMQEVEATESAHLHAERDWYGLAYQGRDMRYNPDPLSEVFVISYADLEPGVDLRDDDQKLCNAVEASRPGGATQRVSAPQSVLAFGTYERRLDVLKTSDASVLDAAYWLVSRYANPGPELREVPIEAYTMPQYSDILDADISSYFSVNALPVQAPATSARVTVEGYAETIRERSHLITFHTSTSATDSVWVLGDPTYSVLGSTTRLAY